MFWQLGLSLPSPPVATQSYLILEVRTYFRGELGTKLPEQDEDAVAKKSTGHQQFKVSLRRLGVQMSRCSGSSFGSW